MVCVCGSTRERAAAATAVVVIVVGGTTTTTATTVAADVFQTIIVELAPSVLEIVQNGFCWVDGLDRRGRFMYRIV